MIDKTGQVEVKLGPDVHAGLMSVLLLYAYAAGSLAGLGLTTQLLTEVADRTVFAIIHHSARIDCVCVLSCVCVRVRTCVRS